MSPTKIKGDLYFISDLNWRAASECCGYRTVMQLKSLFEAAVRYAAAEMLSGGCPGGVEGDPVHKSVQVAKVKDPTVQC